MGDRISEHIEKTLLDLEHKPETPEGMDTLLEVLWLLEQTKGMAAAVNFLNKIYWIFNSNQTDMFINKMYTRYKDQKMPSAYTHVNIVKSCITEPIKSIGQLQQMSTKGSKGNIFTD